MVARRRRQPCGELCYAMVFGLTGYRFGEKSFGIDFDVQVVPGGVRPRLVSASTELIAKTLGLNSKFAISSHLRALSLGKL